MAESRARTLANLANTNALSVDGSSLDVGISSVSPDSDLNVGASIKMDGPSGIITATSFSGDGANLTNVGVDTATVNTGALKVSGVSTLTGVVNASSDVRISGNINAGISTFGAVTVTSISGNGSGLSNVGVDTATVDASTLQVSGISTFKGVVNSSGDVRVTGNLNAGITTATAFVPTTGQLSHRNIIINGAMNISQRGTSSATDGYGSLDRFAANNSGNDELPTQSQASLATGTTPYTLGFRKAYRMTNGNQTGGAAAAARVCILYTIEAQDIAKSGWNYTSASNYISLSFWVKSSIAQNFYALLRSRDGTEQGYTFETGSLTADTWTKITKIIPGNSNIQFDNDNGSGLQIEWNLFRGTDKTGSLTLNQWAAFNASVRVPDMTSTWYTTNDATFELTGVQLEVGSAATPFEHRSFTEELKRCQRYYQVASSIGAGYGSADGYARAGSVYATEMRSTPTFSATNSGSGSIIATGTSNTGFYVTYGSLGGSSAGIFSFIANAEI